VLHFNISASPSDATARQAMCITHSQQAQPTLQLKTVRPLTTLGNRLAIRATKLS